MTNENAFGGWAMNRFTFDYIRSILPEGSTILELGSGHGTGELSKYYKMYSIEANEQWLNKFNSTYIHAPIKYYDQLYTAPSINGNTGWHDYTILKSALKDLKYDLIFIDGPEGKYGRGGFLKHLNLFNTNVPLVFDDVNRSPEKELVIKVSEALNKPYQILSDNITAIIMP
jgi:hypothetical protein